MQTNLQQGTDRREAFIDSGIHASLERKAETRSFWFCFCWNGNKNLRSYVV